MSKTIALIGNPNVGKTVLFNLLTGENRHVGNWPGVTVTRALGELTLGKENFILVDLPGTYSLYPHAEDEKITRDFIIYDKPALVVNVVDASNLERNLYLSSLLIESGANLLLVLNKADNAKNNGFKIDVKKLEQQLGVPVCETVAVDNVGIQNLKEMMKNALDFPLTEITLKYGFIENQINHLQNYLDETNAFKDKLHTRWSSIKLMENDAETLEIISKTPHINQVKLILADMQKELGDDLELEIADSRYVKLTEVSKAVSIKTGNPKPSIENRLDDILLDKNLSIPIFLILMWMTFQLTFSLSTPFTELIHEIFQIFGAEFSPYIPNPWLKSLFIEGIINGWGSILVFMPPIMFLFFALAFLEDSGYLARAAFVMDKIMFKLGLHGRSFIPMLMGFGCNVPAIMAARSIESRNDRILTILVAPLMSCGARLPVYILFAGVFFGQYAGSVIFSIYLLGIILAILMSLLFRKIFFKGEPAPFIIELPPYQLPRPNMLFKHMWAKAFIFLKRASTILLAGSILIWFVTNHPWGVSNLENSYAGYIGKTIEPLFKPLGFDWRAIVALMTGFVAKEVVISSFGMLYNVAGSDSAIGAAIYADGAFTPVTAYAFMAFVLIYMPCLAVVAVTKEETGSWYWTMFSIAYGLLLAYIVSYAIVIFGGIII